MNLKITCPDCGYIEEVKIGKADEIILRIPKDEAEKLRYALDHVQPTGDWHIDAPLNTFNEVLQEELQTDLSNTFRQDNVRIAEVV